MLHSGIICHPGPSQTNIKDQAADPHLLVLGLQADRAPQFEKWVWNQII